MKILIEEYQYPVEVVKNILWRGSYHEVDGKASVNSVGYCFNPDKTVNDCVFIIPKVVLQEGIDGKDYVFGKYEPESIVNMDSSSPLNKAEREFVSRFSVWIYRALHVYIRQYQEINGCDPPIISQQQYCEMGKGMLRRSATLLDVILSLLQFQRDNRDFFLFTIKNIHSGLNKINWTRTIATTTAFMQDDTPVYLNPVNKRRVINFDEELLVIFYSILHYVHRQYGFPAPVDMGYDLITGKKFEHYINGQGKVRLKAIRSKYFSDTAIQLWELCMAFFDRKKQTGIKTDTCEYMLSQNFNIVFEWMIDRLVGNESIAHLRSLADGKEIDHLYFGESLTRRSTEGSKIFYIADSKYYKSGNSLGQESVAKQFTYARDMQQYDVDIFLSGDDASSKVKCRRRDLCEVGLIRDDMMEGYDIIPNFFISATISDGLNFDDDSLVLHKDENEYRSIHFVNRLFDRDTLILSHYDVNFLYLVKRYAQNNATRNTEWSRNVRDKFRDHILKLLNKRYLFYAIISKEEISDYDASRFLREHCKLLSGKLFSQYPKVNGKSVFLLALENPDDMYAGDKLSRDGFKNRKKNIDIENKSVNDLLKPVFRIVSCQLGENPIEALQKDSQKKMSVDDVALSTTQQNSMGGRVI